MGISVVLPNFNDAGRLPRALRALLRQVPAPDEIIVIDDASTDQSIAVIEAFQREHAIVKLLRHSENRGAPAALNTGLAAAKADFVYFAASDDFVLGGFFAEAESTLNRFQDAAYFCAQVVLVDRNAAVVDFRPLLSPSIATAFITPADARRLVRTIDNWAVGQSVVYRRQALLEVGGFDEALGAFCDGITYRRLAFRKGFCFSDRLVAAWQVRPDSLSASSALSESENLRLINEARKQIGQTFPAPLNVEYVDLFVRRLSFNIARMALSTPGAEVDTIARFGVLQNFDRRIISLLGRKTKLSRFAVLGWLTLRLRPFGKIALMRAWLRRIATKRSRSAEAARCIAEAIRL